MLRSIVWLAVFAACGPRTVGSSQASADPSLLLDRATLLRQGAPAGLIHKLERSRMRYFRMLAQEFEVRTCNAFHREASTLPVMAVHGDPHVEQFVVTDTTYGLEDFDRSGFGPAVVDLVRYAASLHVACSEVAWPCNPDVAIEAFLSTYREGLNTKPETRAPTVVQQVRARTPRARASWLAWAEALVEPLPAALDANARQSWTSFANRLQDIDPMWTTSATQIVRLGSLHLGFGSALERKVLIRIAGPTAEPDDDLIVEAREGIPPEAKGCVWRGSYGEPLILMFTAILSRRMPALHGIAPLLQSPRRFWIQSWERGYTELSLADVTSQAALDELAADAARQLAGYLWTQFPEPLRRYQRHAQVEAFDETRPRVTRFARELANESNAAWEQFRQRRAK